MKQIVEEYGIQIVLIIIAISVISALKLVLYML